MLMLKPIYIKNIKDWVTSFFNNFTRLFLGKIDFFLAVWRQYPNAAPKVGAKQQEKKSILPKNERAKLLKDEQRGCI